MQDMNELEFYVTPGPMTDLTSCPPEALEGLPDTPAELMKIARWSVVSDLMLTQLHGLAVPEGRDDPQIRPASAMVERILELDPAPLAHHRPVDRRFLGNCRHFATLSCALIRHKGIPARVRAGFAGYFEPNTWADHWIIEYWGTSEDRWIRVDPQYPDTFFAAMRAGATSESVAQSMYWSGGEAWGRCRRGDLDPDRCNMGGDNWGIGEVRGSVLYDLAALNQDEMLPWDVWAHMHAAYNSETDAAYDELLDEVSAAIEAGDFVAIRAVYDGTNDLRVPAAMAGRSN
jgi:hypothetical protein